MNKYLMGLSCVAGVAMLVVIVAMNPIGFLCLGMVPVLVSVAG